MSAAARWSGLVLSTPFVGDGAVPGFGCFVVLSHCPGTTRRTADTAEDGDALVSIGVRFRAGARGKYSKPCCSLRDAYLSTAVDELLEADVGVAGESDASKADVEDE